METVSEFNKVIREKIRRKVLESEIFFFETGCHHAALIALELAIYIRLPLPPECWR